MKNITLNIIGQRVLADVLKEKEDIIKMNILFFDNFHDYLKNIKENIINNIIIIHFCNFELIERSEIKINNPIFYLTNKKNNNNIQTEFQKYELIYYPLNFNFFNSCLTQSTLKLKFFV